MFARGYAASLLALIPLAGGTAVSGQPSTLPAEASTCVVDIVRGLDLRSRVGQLLLIGVPVDDPSVATPLISGYDVGSIFLAGRSYRSVRSIRASSDAIGRATLRATGIGAYVAIDQEGGLVQSLRGPGFMAMATAERQGSLAPAALRNLTTAWAAELRAAGITLDLAPVADTVSISPPSANPPIGAFHREFGQDPATVARAITAIVPAMQAQQVGSTLKHFPGLGRVRADPDKSAAASDPVASPADPNLAPFVAGIRAGVRAVMMSSATYPRLDPTQPAVVSPRIVTGLLQQQLGFRGLIVSDDIGAAAALRSIPLAQRAIRFIDAGGQLVLSVRPSDAAVLSRALVAHAMADPAFRRRVDAAVLRVVQSKVDGGVTPCARPAF